MKTMKRIKGNENNERVEMKNEKVKLQGGVIVVEGVEVKKKNDNK